MKMRLLVALAAGLLVGAGEPPSCGEVEQVQATLPGSRWLEGGCRVWDFGKDGVLRITDRGGRSILAIPYSTDPKAEPPHFDILGPGTTTEGIYRVEGDRLTICLASPNPNWDKRPTQFANGANSCVATLKRRK